MSSKKTPHKVGLTFIPGLLTPIVMLLPPALGVWLKRITAVIHNSICLDMFCSSICNYYILIMIIYIWYRLVSTIKINF